jgi:hypothetical protein
VEIDLRQPTMVHRIFLTPGRRVMDFPRSLRVFFLDKPSVRFPQFWETPFETSQSQMVEATVLTQTETSLRFNPVRARCIRLEIGPQAAGLPWSVAELEVYGSTDPEASRRTDAVVLETTDSLTLRTAAEELRYYLGELSGRPVPVITPDMESLHPGTLYRIVDLKPLAANYDQMVASREAGKLPEGVNVERNGREVLFRAWPHRDVLWSVYEFLERQGVRWVYPDAHGDYVPEGKGVKLDMLPLRYRPSAAWRYANFGAAAWEKKPISEDYLFWLRTRWDSSWNTPVVLGGGEIPQPDSQKTPQVRGYGYPHSFSGAVPNQALEEHPNWCGMYVQEKWAERVGKENLGKRIPPSKGGPATFCMTNPQVADYVANGILEQAKGNPNATGSITLIPMDAASFCECESCAKLDGPYELEDVAFPQGGRGTPIVSESYYYFVSEVARRIEKKLPQVRIIALAYANYHRPPAKLERLPDNVIVDVCQYGARNLPLESPRSAAFVQRMEEWAKKCRKLRNYDYVLIHCESREMKMPVPLVAAIVSRAKFLRRLGALDGGSQASFNTLPYSPWNYYAYPRLLWNVETTAQELLQDFFAAYFRDAAEPMLRFYKAFEEHLTKNDIDLHVPGYDYGPVPGSLTPEVVKTMREEVKKAESPAKDWFVKERVATMREGLEWAVARLAPLDSQSKTSYPCHRLQEKILIDGKLDDAGWKTVPLSKGFYVGGTTGYALTRQSELRMAWDDEALYVAVLCREPDAGQLKPLNGKHQYGVYGEDSIEFFVAPALGDPTIYYRFAIASNGVLEGPHRYLGSMSNREPVNDSGTETAGVIGADHWCVEARIPFQKVFGRPPSAGQKWLANVSRNAWLARQTGEQATTWSCMPKANWHNYYEYNRVEFLEARLFFEEAQKTEKRLNNEFEAKYPVLLQKSSTVEDVFKAVQGAEDLCKLQETVDGKPRSLVSMGSYPDFTKGWEGFVPLKQPPLAFEVCWTRPVRFDTLLIRWPGLNSYSSKYSVECWDGARYRLVAAEDDNTLATAAYRFEPVTTDRLRLCLYAPAPLKAIEAYDLSAKR